MPEDIRLRRCHLCNTIKPLTDFHRQGAGHMFWCKACRKTYDAAYYTSRRKHVIARHRQRGKELVAWMRAAKAKPCADCGVQFHPAAMAFDHLPGTDKQADLATLAGRGYGRRARTEIAKCEVVCANCHAIRTYERRELRRAEAA